MKSHKIMLVGAVSSGKSSLIAYLNGNVSVAKKTQAVLYDTLSIDTPGEYMENPSMYKYIMAAAQTVEYVLFVQDVTQRRCIYPPGFAQSFNRKTIGIITKVDSVELDVEYSKRCLHALGVKGPIFETSSKTGYGIVKLKEYLEII